MYTWGSLAPIFLIERKARSLNLLAQTFLIAFHAFSKSSMPKLFRLQRRLLSFTSFSLNFSERTIYLARISLALILVWFVVRPSLSISLSSFCEPIGSQTATAYSITQKGKQILSGKLIQSTSLSLRFFRLLLLAPMCKLVKSTRSTTSSVNIGGVFIFLTPSIALFRIKLLEARLVSSY